MHDHIQQPDLDDQQAHRQSATDVPMADVSSPTMHGTPLQKHAAVLQMQRQHGNAFVRRQLANVQRVDIDEMTTAVDSAASPTTGASTSIGDGSASISAQNGVVNIDAAKVNINAPLTEHFGVDKSSTVVTDSVIASTYTPGAGNIM